jgi:hypothetical protein
MKRPSFQFYPADWRKDVELRSCSVAARGLWIDMLCLAHECEPYGHLVVNARPMKAAQIAGQVGLTTAQCEKLIAELVENGVARLTADGTMYSKRMVEDEDMRNRRAEGGKAGSEHGHKGAEHGKKGGRPVKLRGVSKPPLDAPLHPPLEPPPSSSSSSSFPPIPPKGGKPAAICLADWLESVKSSGQKPIPEDDAVFAYAEGVGIPAEFLRLAWLEFRHRYTQPEAKRYRDWRAVFRRCVRGNWLKVWFLDPASNQYGLTTVGLQAQRAHQERRQA